MEIKLATYGKQLEIKEQLNILDLRKILLDKVSDSGIDYVVKHPNIIKVLKSILIDRADEIVNLDEEYTIKAILKSKYRKNIPLYKIIPPQVMDNFVKENTDIETLDGCIDYCVQMKRNLSTVGKISFKDVLKEENKGKVKNVAVLAFLMKCLISGGENYNSLNNKCLGVLPRYNLDNESFYSHSYFEISPNYRNAYAYPGYVYKTQSPNLYTSSTQPLPDLNLLKKIEPNPELAVCLVGIFGVIWDFTNNTNHRRLKDEIKNNLKNYEDFWLPYMDFVDVVFSSSTVKTKYKDKIVFVQKQRNTDVSKFDTLYELNHGGHVLQGFYGVCYFHITKITNTDSVGGSITIKNKRNSEIIYEGVVETGQSVKLNRVVFDDITISSGFNAEVMI